MTGAPKPIHPFPARMAPEIALRALEGIPEGGVVLDPMSGSGSVLRAANEHGLRAVGVDVDPLAVLMARVWTTPLKPSSLRRASTRVVETARTLDPADVELPAIDHDPKTRQFVDFWFAPRQAEDLRRLVGALPPADSKTGRALRLLVSRLIVTKDRGASRARDVSHSRPHRVYDDSNFDVLRGFERASERLARQLELDPPPGGSSVYFGDARRLRGIRDQSVDAVITSPPYINAIDYLRGHRLALVWLGYRMGRLGAIRSGSVGAERAPSREVAHHVRATERCLPATRRLSRRFRRIMRRYLSDMDQFLCEVRRVLEPSGQATIVIGNSNLEGVYVDNARALSLLASWNSLELTDEYKRELSAQHRYLPPPQGRGPGLASRMRTEVVLTFSPN